MSEPRTIHLQRCLERLRTGDEAARKELLDLACGRLQRLAHRMVRDEARLRRWEEADDVFQSAMLRLYRALTVETPETPRAFFRLAALQIRRELIDLARRYFGPHGFAAHHDTVPPGDSSAPPPEPADVSRAPDRLAEWTEFHEYVESLPEDEREVFDLVWYQGLTRAEAADLLGVTTKTIRRRWQSICLRIHQRFQDSLADLS